VCANIGGEKSAKTGVGRANLPLRVFGFVRSDAFRREPYPPRPLFGVVIPVEWAYPPSVKTILVTVDFSDVSPRLIDVAQKLAATPDSRVILLHVREFDQGEFMPEFAVPGYVPMPVIIPVKSPPKGEEQERLQRLKESAASFPGEVEALVIEGATVPTILETSRTRHADLIVMGSHGHGAVYNLLLGSVTAGVLKSAKCPVLVVPSEGK